MYRKCKKSSPSFVYLHELRRQYYTTGDWVAFERTRSRASHDIWFLDETHNNHEQPSHVNRTEIILLVEEEPIYMYGGGHQWEIYTSCAHHYIVILHENSRTKLFLFLSLVSAREPLNSPPISRLPPWEITRVNLRIVGTWEKSRIRSFCHIGMGKKNLGFGLPSNPLCLSVAPWSSEMPTRPHTNARVSPRQVPKTKTSSPIQLIYRISQICHEMRTPQCVAIRSYKRHTVHGLQFRSKHASSGQHGPDKNPLSRVANKNKVADLSSQRQCTRQQMMVYPSPQII